MSSDSPKVGRIKCAAIYLAFVALAVWIVVETITQFRDFFSSHHGIEFYREKPYLIGICIVVAVIVGLCAKFISERRGKRKKQ